jgi:hypothetical protein
MQKATNDSLHFRARAGNFSTHGSRRGVNMLGWDEGTKEDMTPDQERAALIAHNRRLQDMLKHGELTAADRKTIGRDLAVSSLRLSELRPQTKKGREVLMERYILDVLKEVLPHETWKEAVDEAYKRMARFNGRTGNGRT